MKTKFWILIIAAFTLSATGCRSIKSTETNNYVIQKKNGSIILAYKAFEDFLNSDKTWDSYRTVFLDAYPSVRKVHNRQIEWGEIDSMKFPGEVGNYKKEDFTKYMSLYDIKTMNYLYDSIIERADKILPHVTNRKVDLCFFLPYGGGCFVIPEDSLCTIYISLYIDPGEAEKIMAHEYAHVMHIDRRPSEPLSLKREIISEGMAVYLTNLILKDIDVSNSIPFMTGETFAWCLKNEKLIRDSIKLELNDSTMQFFKRYISDGDYADPPAGFPQKTGFFTGYRIIEKCIKNGMSLAEVSSLGSEAIIKKSRYFED